MMGESKLLQNAIRILKVKNADCQVNSKTQDISIKTKDGQELKCFIPAALYIGQLSSQQGFIGNTKEEEADVYQWLEYCILHNFNKENTEILNELNKILNDRVYLVSNRFTMADLLLYLKLHECYSKMSFQDKESYNNVSRWFRQIQKNANATDFYPEIRFSKTRLYS